MKCLTFFSSWIFRYKLLFWIQLKTLVSVIVFQNSFCTISLDMMMFWCLQSKVWLNMKTIKVFSGQYGFTRIYGSFKIQDLRNLLVKREKNPNTFCNILSCDWFIRIAHVEYIPFFFWVSFKLPPVKVIFFLHLYFKIQLENWRL